MKYSDMNDQNKTRLKMLEMAGGKKRKQYARHGVQFKSDPMFNRGKQGSVNVWEFDVDPSTWNYGCYRLLRRQEGSDVTWWYATHVGENSFKYEKIDDIPSFKPVKQTPNENAAVAEAWKPLVDPVLEAVEISSIKVYDPDNPFGLSKDDLDFLAEL